MEHIQFEWNDNKNSKVIGIKSKVRGMKKTFNIAGTCYPEESYMVDMEGRLREIEKLVDVKKYFTINRARQYGKTTLLNLMVQYLSSKYTVFSVSFEGLGDSVFEKEASFCGMICKLLYDAIRYDEVPALEVPVKNIIYEAVQNHGIEDLFGLSAMISELCGAAKRPVILMIDEVDQLLKEPGTTFFLFPHRKVRIPRVHIFQQYNHSPFITALQVPFDRMNSLVYFIHKCADNISIIIKIKKEF